MTRIGVIIPAYNEAAAIAKVIAELPPQVNEVVVVNNNSTDSTASIAKAAGATVLSEKRKGYGYACLKGLTILGKTHLLILSSFSTEITPIILKS